MFSIKETVRRSPRNHKAPPQTTLNCKAASIKWDSWDLEAHLVCAMESNRRWREGIFSLTSTKSTSHSYKANKTQCFEEVARVLFSRHPYFRDAYNKKPASFARAVKDKLDRFPLYTGSKMPPPSTKITENPAMMLTSTANHWHREAWTLHRIVRPVGESSKSVPLWRPALPIELQHEILRFAALSVDPPETIDYAVAANLRLVNSTWAAIVDPLLYNTIKIRKAIRYGPLFGHGGFLSQPGSPVRYTKVLKLYVQPPGDSLLRHRYFSPHIDVRIPEVHFDIACSRNQFWIIDRLPRDAHIQEFANGCMTLYQLLLDLQSESLHLFMTKPIDEATEDLVLWSEVMAGHIAALKLMTHLRKLVIEGDLFMTLLPACVKNWAHMPTWETILALVKDDNATLPTLLDETHLIQITFVHSHVPTLAFLARMALAPNIKKVVLAGWNKGDDVPASWLAYIAKEREADDPIISWEG